MTDVNEAEVKQSGRGRPRPQDTIQRDERVYKALLEHGEPASRDKIAEIVGIKSSYAYLSLIRLRRDGYVERVASNGEGAKSHTWAALEK